MFRLTRPKSINNIIQPLSKGKVPRFFLYAKDKKDGQVAPYTSSPVNRLSKLIYGSRLRFDRRELGKFDPHMLMHSPMVPNNEITKQIIEVYQDHAQRMTSTIVRGEDENHITYWPYQKMMDELDSVYGDRRFIVDVLVKHLFIDKRTKRKRMFWECFGGIILDNIRHNLDANSCMCVKCGTRFVRESNRQVMCKDCADKARRQQKAASEKLRRHKQVA